MKRFGAPSTIEILKNHLSEAEFQKSFPLPLWTLLEELHSEFDGNREQLLSERRDRQNAFDLGVTPKFECEHIAKLFDWKVAAIPTDL